MDIIRVFNRIRPRAWPVAIGQVSKSVGKYIDQAGLAIMGPYAPTEKLSTHRRLVFYENQKPSLGGSSFIAPSATVVGGVTFGKAVAVMYGVVVRGEKMKVSFGESVYIGDHSVVSPSLAPSGNAAQQCKIGSFVNIGTGCTIHNCTIEDGATIGNGSVVGAGAKVERQAVLAGGSVLQPGQVVPSRQYWSGSPAQFVRNLTDEELEARSDELERVLAVSDRHNYWHDLSLQERELLKMSTSRDPLGDEMNRREAYRF